MAIGAPLIAILRFLPVTNLWHTCSTNSLGSQWLADMQNFTRRIDKTIAVTANLGKLWRLALKSEFTIMSPTKRAVLWMICAILCFSAMAVGGRMVSAELNTFELMTYRSLIGILCMCLLLTVMGRWADARPRRMKTQFTRNIAHFIGQNLWFFGLATIPLSKVIALEFTTPLWVAVMAPFLIGERFTTRKFATTLLGFVGVLIIIQPGNIEIETGTIAVLFSAIAFAITMLITKRLTGDTSAYAIMFYVTVMQAVFGALCMVATGSYTMVSADLAGWMIIVGIAGVGAHFCLTTALSLAPATIISPMDFARLPLLTVVGAVFFFEEISLFVALGATFVFIANYLNILAESRRNLEN